MQFSHCENILQYIASVDAVRVHCRFENPVGFAFHSWKDWEAPKGKKEILPFFLGWYQDFMLIEAGIITFNHTVFWY